MGPSFDALTGKDGKAVNTKEVIQAIRTAMSRHKGSEKELYEALVDEASAWEMRLEELENEEEDDS